MRYLLILEDGYLMTKDNCEEEMSSADEGYLDIVDMELGKQYFDGGWVNIKVYEE
jgi:hypothetical protein